MNMTGFRIGSIHQRKVSETRVRCLLKEVRANDGVTQLYFCHIDFSDDKVLDGMTKLFVRDARRFSSIKFLSCSGSSLSKIITMIMDHSSTGSLTLSNCCKETSVFNALNESLRTNQSLKVLRLSGSSFFAECCLDDLRYNCTLKELDLRGNHLSEAAVKSLSTTLRKSSGLEILKLDNCDLEDSTMTQIMESLIDHKTLKELDLSNNAASSKALHTMAQLIQGNRVLRRLSMNALRVQENLDPAVLFQAIAKNTSLSHLDISGNHFTDEAVHGLTQALCVNSTLASLDVSDGNISEAGIQTFAQHLPSFKALKVLNLTENKITENAAMALVQGLEDNRMLQSLGPLEMVDDYECTHFLEHYLDLNLAGRRALQNDISLGIWPHLLARTAQAGLRCGRNENALFALLRGPALFER